MYTATDKSVAEEGDGDVELIIRKRGVYITISDDEVEFDFVKSEDRSSTVDHQERKSSISIRFDDDLAAQSILEVLDQ